jgi:hypothetical protein
LLKMLIEYETAYIKKNKQFWLQALYAAGDEIFLERFT